MNLLFRLKNQQKIVNNKEKKPKTLIKLNISNSNILIFLLKETNIISAEKDKNNFKFLKLSTN